MNILGEYVKPTRLYTCYYLLLPIHKRPRAAVRGRLKWVKAWWYLEHRLSDLIGRRQVSGLGGLAQFGQAGDCHGSGLDLAIAQYRLQQHRPGVHPAQPQARTEDFAETV